MATLPYNRDQHVVMKECSALSIYAILCIFKSYLCKKYTEITMLYKVHKLKLYFIVSASEWQSSEKYIGYLADANHTTNYQSSCYKCCTK